jgi:hypothetical protein
MASVFVPDTLPARPRGESFGLSVRAVTDPAARNTFLPKAASVGTARSARTSGWTARRATMKELNLNYICAFFAKHSKH